MHHDDFYRGIYYYDGPDGLRARITNVNTSRAHITRLVIRTNHGQGAVILNRTYTTRRGARAALSRRGVGWACFKKTMF